MDLRTRLRWVYSAKSRKDLTARYDSWALNYDRELEDLLGYVGPQLGAEMLARHVFTDALILDVGAGTGLVGGALRQLGFRNLVAVDASEGMLSQARAKRIYDALYHRDLGGDLPFRTASFDAAISIGVFTYGHAQPSCLEELLRITKRGGYIVFSLRPDFYESSGFKPALSFLELMGRWKLIETSEAFPCFSKSDSGDLIRLWAYRVEQSWVSPGVCRS